MNSLKTYEEREKEILDLKIRLYKDLQNDLINNQDEVNVNEPFRLVILDPDSEDNKFNYNRGFFTTGNILYKDETVAFIEPNFIGYSNPKLDVNRFSVEVYGSFRDLLTQINYKDDSFNEFLRVKDFNEIQDCIDYLLNVRSLIKTEISKFLS